MLIGRVIALGYSTTALLATKEDANRIERKLIEHDGELKTIKWMLGVIVGGVMLLVLKAFFPIA